MTLEKGPVKATPFDYDKPLSSLKGVGPQTRKRFAQLGLETYRDALFHFPIRYEDRTRLTALQDVLPESKYLIQAKVVRCQRHHGRRPWLEVVIQDKTAQLSLIFFHFSKNQQMVFEKKPWVRCFAQVSINQGKRVMVHPELIFLKHADEPVDERLTPIYPTTQGLHQGQIRKLIHAVLADFKDAPCAEILPELVREKHPCMTFQQAIQTIHEPTPEVPTQPLLDRTHAAYVRLALEELMVHQVTLRQLRFEVAQEQAESLSMQGPWIESFIASLPFELTQAQKRAWQAIGCDIQRHHPMTRLVQGDVGSGKTVVAALACLAALQQAHQAVMMAPTEILAKQHYAHFKSWFEPLGISVVLIVGSMKSAEKKQALEKMATQTPCMIIGTHALFQEKVQFKHLSMMVVDEQHRFGVEQRIKLRDKGQANVPHQLIMTATPIPRSLAMTRFADLDLTMIDELPPNRKPVTTVCICQSKRDQVIERIQAVCHQGQQVYWVCPLIEESEKLEIQAAEQSYEMLQAQLSDTQVGLVHGKIPAQEKTAIMDAFQAGKLQVLVATTVIEVGVNVPNASLMIIENPERLGLAQLHQLRGRVGRGALQSYCVLLFKTPLSAQAQQRLKAMRDTQDGFKIADMDLKLRGPGEVLGVRQTGIQIFKVVDLVRDRSLIESINHVISSLSPQMLSEYLKKAQSRWLGHHAQYAKV